MKHANSHVYRRSESGELAFRTQDRAVPLDYQRILGVLGEPCPFKVVCSLLPQYDEGAIAEWLVELEELGLLEREGGAAPAAFGEHFASGEGARLTLVEEDAAGLDAAAASAGSELTNKGAYMVARGRAARLQPGRPGKTTVLVVEDDADQMALADVRLTMAGYEVRVADSVAGLVASLETYGVPDVVLLDVMLPDGNGFEVLGRMRRHPALTSVPVVMLTAKTDPGDIREGLRAGADAYITKPYSKRILAETLARLLAPASGG